MRLIKYLIIPAIIILSTAIYFAFAEKNMESENSCAAAVAPEIIKYLPYNPFLFKGEYVGNCKQ